MENAMANLKDMSTSYLDGEVKIFAGWGMSGWAKISNDLRDIGKSNGGEEWLADLTERLGELENRIEIIDEITNAKLMKEKGEMAKRKGNLEKQNTTLRNSLQE